MAQTERYMETR